MKGTSISCDTAVATVSSNEATVTLHEMFTESTFLTRERLK